MINCTYWCLANYIYACEIYYFSFKIFFEMSIFKTGCVNGEVFYVLLNSWICWLLPILVATCIHYYSIDTYSMHASTVN